MPRSVGNIRRWLEAAVARHGEPLEAIVVGQHDNTRWDGGPLTDENVILNPEDGLRKLDYDYDSGYGGADCHPMYAWTVSRIYFISEYDGSTGLSWVPRHPVDIEPGFGGN